MLNWDDFHEDENATAPAAEKPAPQAEAKPAAQPEPEAVRESAGTYKVADNDRLARARKALDELDVAAGLEELEMGAARIEVHKRDKRSTNHGALQEASTGEFLSHAVLLLSGYGRYAKEDMASCP